MAAGPSRRVGEEVEPGGGGRGRTRGGRGRGAGGPGAPAGRGRPRPGPAPGPAPGSSKRLPIRSASWATLWRPMPATASSMASGMPSRRRQISAAAASSPGASRPARGSAARSRSAKSRSASDAPSTGSGPTATRCSPRVPSGRRLVTSTVSPGEVVRRSASRWEQGVRRCSAESRTSRSRLSPSHSQSASTGMRRLWSASPTASETVGSSSPWSGSGERSAHQAPSSYRSAAARAARSASRVLPTPPGPIRVVIRCVVNAVCSRASSARLPTKLLVSSGGVPPWSSSPSARWCWVRRRCRGPGRGLATRTGPAPAPRWGVRDRPGGPGRQSRLRRRRLPSP